MIVPVIKLLRIRQWLKNLMLFFPPFLGGAIVSDCFIQGALVPFCGFCAVSSATYVINDILDKTNDGHHPIKCNRPIASGQVNVVTALILAVFLLIAGFTLAYNVPGRFSALLVAYLLLSLAYSAILKDIVLVDIFCISSGFILRLHAGGEAFSIKISEWLFLSVFLLSLFLSAGKRLAEKQQLGDIAVNHRKALLSYPAGFLEGTMYMTGSAVLVTYTMYILSRYSQLLMYTVPLCFFGLFRYILRVQSGKGGDPTESLLQDVPLLIIGVAWAGMVGWAIYGI